MIMITLSTFLSVIVFNIYLRGDKKGKLPRWLKKVSGIDVHYGRTNIQITHFYHFKASVSSILVTPTVCDTVVVTPPHSHTQTLNCN